MIDRHPVPVKPGLAGPRRSTTSANDARHVRFVTQSHALGAPKATPGALLIAAAVAVAIFVIGLRLSGE